MPHLLREWPIDDLAQAFQQAQPFRHVVIDHFLANDFCTALLNEFPAFDPQQAVNEMGLVGGKAVVDRLPQIGPSYRQFDQLIQSPEFLAKVGNITSIPNLLYDPHYFGGGTHENRHGQDLDIHVDFNYHPKDQTHRRLNLIVFLNPVWEASWGGCLELHRDPWGAPADDLTVSVVPLLNRCVIFETTESSWHGFRRIQLPDPGLSRRSLAIYFYSADRPAAEAAPAHGTIYVPWAIPAHLQPGHTLTEADVEALDEQFRRRDQLLRFLYEREKEFSTALESPSFKLSRLLMTPARAAKKLLKGSW